MISPFTGGKVGLRQELREIIFRNEKLPMSHKCKPMVRNSHNWVEHVWGGLYEESEYAAKMVDKVAPWSKWVEGVWSAK